MSTKKGNDSDDEYSFDPLEALADVVTGDAFTFFDEPAKAVENAVKDKSDDTRAEGGTGTSGGSGGSAGQQPVTVKPLAAPSTGTGKAPGKQKQAEGGDSGSGGKADDKSGEKPGGEPAAS